MWSYKPADYLTITSNTSGERTTIKVEHITSLSGDKTNNHTTIRTIDGKEFDVPTPYDEVLKAMGVTNK